MRPLFFLRNSFSSSFLPSMESRFVALTSHHYPEQLWIPAFAGKTDGFVLF
jgi:hypothetical protein